MKITGTWGRVVTGMLLAAAVLLVVTVGPTPLLAFLVAAWSLLATLEFIRLLKIAEIHLNPWLLGPLNLSVAAAAWLGWLPGFLLAPIAVVLVTAVALREPKPRVPVYGVFSVIYLGFLPAHLLMLRRLNPAGYGEVWLAAFPLLLTWLNDTAAWGIGKLFGRHKLAPSMSPKKTWEGFLAGLVVSAVFTALALPHMPAFSGRSWALLASFGIGLAALAQVGDLFESIFKRAVSIKDSSGILGEHGGFLDRVDSLLFVIPAWYYLLLLYIR